MDRSRNHLWRGKNFEWMAEVNNRETFALTDPRIEIGDVNVRIEEPPLLAAVTDQQEQCNKNTGRDSRNRQGHGYPPCSVSTGALLPWTKGVVKQTQESVVRMQK